MTKIKSLLALVSLAIVLTSGCMYHPSDISTAVLQFFSEPLTAGCIEMIWIRKATGREVRTVYYYHEFDEATKYMPLILQWLGDAPPGRMGKGVDDPVVSVRKFRCAKDH